MTQFYKNCIVGIFWLTVLSTIIMSNTSQMFLTLLFSVLVLHFSEDVTQKIFAHDKVIEIFKGLFIGLGIGFLFTVGYNAFYSLFNPITYVYLGVATFALAVAFYWDKKMKEGKYLKLLKEKLSTIDIKTLPDTYVKKFVKYKNSKKITSVIMSAVIISMVLFCLYHSFKSMWLDFNQLMVESQSLVISTLKSWGMSDNINTVQEIYDYIFGFLKQNVTFIAVSAGLLIKVIIGIILGIILHFTTFDKESIDHAWGSVLNTIVDQCKTIYSSFKNVMTIQILVAIMNTVIIFTFALPITYVLQGEFLPYWYVVVPLTAILSLVPVVGNILINLILALTTIQISITYVFVGLGLFLVIHKLELLVIGKKMQEKVNVPFVIILFSMIIGELVFHSMSGMIIGMVIVVALSNMLKNVKMIKAPVAPKRRTPAKPKQPVKSKEPKKESSK